MKKTFIAAFAAIAALSASAALTGIEEKNWVSGPKLAASDVFGKVVVVFDCSTKGSELGPRMEQVWSSFKSKKLLVIGSVKQGGVAGAKTLAKTNKFTFPIYVDALPDGVKGFSWGSWIYVLDHHGRVIKVTDGDRAATEALVEALGNVGKPPSLYGRFVFEPKSPVKAYEKRLVLGAPIDPVLKDLEKKVAAGEKKGANDKIREVAGDAASLISAVNDGKAEIRKEIEELKKSNPPEALKMATLYSKSFPKDEDNFKSELSEMKKAAAEWTKEQKEKAKEAAKAAKEAKSKKGDEEQ